MLRITFLLGLLSVVFTFTACLSGDGDQHTADAGEHGSADDHKKSGENGHDANSHMNKTPFEELVKRFEDPQRSEWQKPEAVIGKLGRLAGKVVADIGAGTGYFSFPIAEKAAMVIAIDIDQRFLDHIRQRNEDLEKPLPIELRLSKEDNALLGKDEADIVPIVNTYHHIGDRVNYFSAVRESLKSGGRLWVVDFRKEELPMGPPVDMKLSAESVAGELQSAGYRDIQIDRDTLPYQYLVSGKK